jgi:hypothetical protein
MPFGEKLFLDWHSIFTSSLLSATLNYCMRVFGFSLRHI